MSRLFFSQTPGAAAGLPRHREPAAEVPEQGRRLLRGEAAADRLEPLPWDAGDVAADPRAPDPEPDRAAGGPATALLAEARRRAEALREEAAVQQAAAAQLLAEAEAMRAEAAAARAQAQALRDEAAAQQAAAARSLAGAQAQAAAAESALAGAQERVAMAVAAARQEALTATEGELVQLAMAVARRILRQELSLRPEAVAAMVSEALARVAGDPAPQLWCAPADAALLQAAVGRQPEPRPGLAPGEFLVRSREGDVDGRLEAQLAEVAAALAEASSGQEEP